MAPHSDAISYEKGASLLFMLMSYLGEGPFLEGVRIFLKRHAYSCANGEDLWAALSESSGVDCRQLTQAWIHEVGVLLTIVRAYSQTSRPAILCFTSQRAMTDLSLNKSASFSAQLRRTKFVRELAYQVPPI